LFGVDEISMTRIWDERNEKFRQNCGWKPESNILLGEICVDGKIILKRMN
jgi:hypothetical protein